MLLIWRTMKGFALLEGKLGELRLTLVPNVMMSNACRTDICRLLSPTVFDDCRSVTSSLFQLLPGTKSNPQISLIANVPSPVLWFLRTLVERMACQAYPSLHRRKYYPRCRSKSQHNSPSQFFGNLSSSVSELLSTDQGAQYFHRPPIRHIYRKSSGHFWKISF